MPVWKFSIGLGEAAIKHEFVHKKGDITTFECRELVSAETNGSDNICLFKAVFGPREEHAKHRHTKCDEIVYCISGRGVEGIEVEPGKWQELSMFPGRPCICRPVAATTREIRTTSRICTSWEYSSGCRTWTRKRPATCRKGDSG